MIRLFLGVVLLLVTGSAATTKEKISSSSASLSATTKQERQIGQKLEAIANDISNERKALENLAQEIETLQGQIKTLQEETKEATQELEVLKTQNTELEKTKQELEQRMIRIIAEQFSFHMVTDQGYQESIESIIADAVLEKMDALIKKDFKELSAEYSHTNEEIRKRNRDITKLNESLKGLRTKESALLGLRDKQRQSLAELDKQNALYRKRLGEIYAEKKELQETLERLKIVQRAEEEKKAQAEAEAAARAAAAAQTPSEAQQVTVRQIGSSYQSSRVKRYSGQKTIAPLDSFEVKQAFGNYVDPIYKIKIFNESVVLRSKTPLAQVKNVLGGKVVYAGNTNMLNHVVIVENSNGIHTIYAQMTQIAPTIKVGSRIKEGYVIGRIDQDLTFEVTQQNFHINPLELITVR
ncbi:peptidoglycan DD-metalloendopeptidase family protein [Sulfurospirillum sp. T05]|uniref:Peptidoglycan DD-metalloendopeptidase family protein n=1 Tax=Sulfurospirillum tamanense TaxID=2813362 RepID=A0ABS2WVJ3_9BACT|nr:peptidoglycan DD-metalloendopeptidase family protein [Sulfurospirillum tamanensis]MBN2965244.1 peptidoglycan DD-metalloendopeptidase family protein [Sulfurospirillum tamanensis]